MPRTCILFGSIGTLAETSELQRLAFNQAFAEAGLDWCWSPRDYERSLLLPGDRARIAQAARDAGREVDADALYHRKTELFHHRMQELGLTLRPGVSDVIDIARGADVPLGFCSTATRATVDRMLAALEAPVTPETFAFVGHRGMVKHPKPDPEIYARALYALDVAPGDAMAVEDTPEAAGAAMAAGIATIAFPGQYHTHRDFGAVRARHEALSPGLFGL